MIFMVREYINGERNKYGKEYEYKERLIFEGEYINNKRWNGKIKDYDNNGNLFLDCEMKNGERNGMGQEYCDNRLIYEGEFLHGKRHGRGKEYYNNEEIYELISKKGLNI